MNIAAVRLAARHVATARNELLHEVKPRSHAGTSRECNLATPDSEPVATTERTPSISACDEFERQGIALTDCGVRDGHGWAGAAE
jgi:hypothetical protein